MVAVNMRQDAGGNVWGTSTTAYTAVGVGSMGADPEAQSQITVRTAGVYSFMTLEITSNQGAFTLNFRKNGANGNQTITTPASPTGEFVDSTHTDSPALADKINFQGISGAGGTSTTAWAFNVLFAATSNTVVRFAAQGNDNESVDSTTNFMCLVDTGVDTAAETDAQHQVRTTGTFQNLFINVATNGRVTATTHNFRKNAAAGNQTISVAGGATGIQEDTTHTDGVVAGDKVNYTIVTSTGGGTFLPRVTGVELSTTNGAWQTFTARGTGTTLSFAGEQVSPIGGFLSSVTTANETDVNMTFRLAQTASNLTAHVISNARTTTTNLFFRTNGTDSAITVSYASTATGFVTDTTHTLLTATTDTVDHSVSTGAGAQNIVIGTIGILFTGSTTPNVPVTLYGAAIPQPAQPSRTIWTSQNIANPPPLATTRYSIPYPWPQGQSTVLFGAPAQQVATTFPVFTLRSTPIPWTPLPSFILNNFLVQPPAFPGVQTLVSTPTPWPSLPSTVLNNLLVEPTVLAPSWVTLVSTPNTYPAQPSAILRATLVQPTVLWAQTVTSAFFGPGPLPTTSLATGFVVSAPLTHIKTVDTIILASVKTFNGIPAASVKTVDGIINP